MNLTQVFILGLVQGLTEFLPVSSTAHLILLPWFFKFPDPGLSFDISLHLGTLLAVLIYFGKEWTKLWEAGHSVFQTATSASSLQPQRHSTQFFSKGGVRVALEKGDAHLFIILIFATIPGLVFGFLLESWAETGLRSPFLIAANLVIFGILLWLVDSRLSHSDNLSYLSKAKAFFIGLWQALAIIPGVSRSGATITGGLLAGLKREEAVKFSFMLSAPIIAGSVLVSLSKIMESGSWIMDRGWWVGILTSFLFGFLAIKFLLKFVQKRSFLPFVIYRILLAILLLIWT